MRPGASLEGLVTDGDGQPIPGASIFLRTADTSDEYLQRFTSVSTDTGGSFVYPGIPAGRFDVVCKATGFALTEKKGVTVTESEATRIQLELMGGTEVSIRLNKSIDELFDLDLEVIGPDGQLVSGLVGFSDLVATPFQQIAAGVYPLGTYAPGTYVVRGSYRGRPFDEKIELRGEPSLEIPLSLDDAAE